MSAAIAGLGVALPDTIVTNDDLARRLDTSDEWIVSRTGIRQRRVAGDDETTATLATEAGIRAIKDAGIAPSDIDILIVATCTPDQPLPATAARVQDAIGLTCGAFDLAAACSGFVYAAVTADALVRTGGAGAALIIGAETLTRIIDPEDRTTAILFGDGAAAAVLTPSGPGTGLLSWDLGCDGSAADILEVPAGGSRLPSSADTVRDRLHYVHMDGQEVFRRAVRVTVASAEATMEKAGVSPADIAWFVPHQANQRIIDAASLRLGIPEERVVVNLDRVGNTSAASIGLALSEIEPADGDLVLLAGFGAGMTWASALFRWVRS